MSGEFNLKKTSSAETEELKSEKQQGKTVKLKSGIIKLASNPKILIPILVFLFAIYLSSVLTGNTIFGVIGSSELDEIRIELDVLKKESKAKDERIIQLEKRLDATYKIIDILSQKNIPKPKEE
jgi:hypothetical protein